MLQCVSLCINIFSIVRIVVFIDLSRCGMWLRVYVGL